MKKILLATLTCISIITTKAQGPAKVVYGELGGPGLASINYDMRFKKQEGGFGFRVGVGGFTVSDYYGGHDGILSVPLGLNYIVGKDQKNYFEVGAGFTYIHATTSDGYTSGDFSTSFGNLTLGYRLAPAKGGFFFKAQIAPVFGKGFFIPYWAGIAFGYKF